MKQRHFLLAAMLATSLAPASVAWAAGQPAVVKTKAKLAKAAKRLPHSATRPTRIDAGGMALALSTTLQRVPAAPSVPAVAVTTPVSPAALPTQVTAVPAWPGPARYTGPAHNPYLPRPVPSPQPMPQAVPQSLPFPPAQAFGPIQAVPDRSPYGAPPLGLGQVFSGLGAGIPLLPESGRSILPTVKKVYPTGEKPLVVVSFKCPTEVIGVTPPTIKLLHDLVDMGMDGLNRTDLLSFNLQQVCQ